MHEEYDVLRLIEHNRICYVSSDNVKGCSMAKWLRFHPFQTKEQILKWIYDMIRQLVQIHKCRGNPCYQYVNPYSVIVTVEGKLCFLDASAESNKERVRMMHRWNIKEFFFLKEDTECQESGEEGDIFGIGKTIQYIMAFAVTEPEFTRKEERKLQRLIERCTNRKHKKAFKKIADVWKYVSEMHIS